jgi:ATP-binding protein involved in chromosome partitioning
MVHGAIQQFLKDFDWGELDYLVVDLPPGTGDAPLSLSQLIPLSGVVIVTTPQDVALQDVAKGMAMFKQLEVPIIGVIENMSYFICPNCSEKHELFGRGGGERIAKTFNVPFLGQIPLQMNVRTGGDEGKPVVMADPESPAGILRRAQPNELVSLDEDEPAQPLRCQIEQFQFSAHAPRDSLLGYIKKIAPQKVVLVHGDPRAVEWMRAAASAALPKCEVIVPIPGVEMEL